MSTNTDFSKSPDDGRIQQQQQQKSNTGITPRSILRKGGNPNVTEKIKKNVHFPEDMFEPTRDAQPVKISPIGSSSSRAAQATQNVGNRIPTLEENTAELEALDKRLKEIKNDLEMEGLGPNRWVDLTQEQNVLSQNRALLEETIEKQRQGKE